MVKEKEAEECVVITRGMYKKRQGRRRHVIVLSSCF